MSYSRFRTGVQALVPEYQCKVTLWQNVYACTRLSLSGHFFSHTFQSDQILPCRALVTYKLQTSFSAWVKPENPLVQKSKTRKMNEFSKETVFSLPSALHVVFSFLFLNLALQEFYFSQLVYKHNRKYKSDQMLNFLIMRCAVRFAAVLCSIPVSLTPGSLWGNWGSFKVLL